MNKSNGFSLIEVLVASGIILMIATTLVPLISLLNNERELLSTKRSIIYQLHDELQPYIWNSSQHLPHHYKDVIKGTEVEFSFSKVSGNYMKGCANWMARESKKELCLYGLPKE